MKKTVLKKFFATILAVCLTLSAFGQAAAAASSPSDIKGSWAEEILNNWVQKGWLKGYSDGSVHPNQNVTRAEFFTLINNALGLTAQTDIAFSDVKPDDWFYKQVAIAVKSGYIKGYKDGTVKPNANVSRQEVAVIAAALLKLPGAPQAADKFKDAASIGNWSKPAVGALTAIGVMKGHPDGTFMPTKSVTRAEAVVVIHNALDKLNNKTFDKAGFTALKQALKLWKEMLLLRLRM
ncbi:S-layer homology domain-containing protein [Cohnella cholangitidis]|uniref:S-layer homology domain-containing protein n=1 Tax=Cohnella cholangitidis TaxID=2598458 RepID=A0A7G5BZD8_9BACL|nr:S-layer homology domain-containing protein [Cohnella cholangitidis]QMV42322.1 S-layer homology domain-containing protein [Cohnella cholangitidis]